MNIVLLGHPEFFGSHSMNRFAAMIADGMGARGHQVTLLTPKRYCCRLATTWTAKKWLGYIDQYILFPAQLRWRMRTMPSDTLFVLADHALGMYMSVIGDRPHIVHSHDFTALRGLIGELPDFPPSPTGKIYQRLIRRGFRRARHFVAVSRKTATDLARFHGGDLEECSVVYNGLNYPYRPLSADEAMGRLQRAGIQGPVPGMLLHIGGNQWYKNRVGVVALYLAYCQATPAPRPLCMVGWEPEPDAAALAQAAREAGGTVHWLGEIPTDCVHAVYSLASALVFPSHEEGFGWPIIEAMACGTPVLTTDRAPMNEIAGDVATLIEPQGDLALEEWARRNAPAMAALANTADAPAEIRAEQIARVLAHASQFSAEHAMEQYEQAYLRALRGQRSRAARSRAHADDDVENAARDGPLG